MSEILYRLKIRHFNNVLVDTNFTLQINFIILSEI